MPVLTGRLERRLLLAVVVAGVLLLAAAVWVFVNKDRVEVWLTGDEVVAGQRTATTVPLPEGLEDDPTRSACEPWTALRCAWSDDDPEAAAVLMAGALADAGLDVGDVVCSLDDQGPVVPDSIVAADAVCAAPVQVALDRMWVVSTDRTPDGHVPLGRTAVWVVWDENALSSPMYERVQAEWGWRVTDRYAAPTAEDIAGVVPERFAALLDEPCRSESVDGCSDWEGPIDLSDLGSEPVQALVLELTDAGYFVDGADPEMSGGVVGAHRFLRAGSPEGLSLVIRMIDGELRGQLFTY